MEKIKTILSTKRIVNICALLLIAISTFISYKFPEDTKTFLPTSAIFIINHVCLVLCAVIIIDPTILFIEVAILFLQSFLTVWLGLEIIGLFLYSAMIIKLFIFKFFVNKAELKKVLLSLIWLVISFGVLPYGRARLIILINAYNH